MKSSLLVLLVTLLAIPCAAKIDTVTIVHMNDTHSNLAPIGPRNGALEGEYGGIARAATVIGMAKMEDPRTLVLHGGDVSIGDLFYTKYFASAELQLLNALGVDAMTLGNHEFDLGPLYLTQMLDSAFVGGGFPLLSANAILADPAVQGLAKYISPYLIKTVGSTRIGIFGLTTPSTMILSNPSPVAFDTSAVGLAMVAAGTVDTLRKQGCTVVVCLSHLGVSADNLLAGFVPGINLIVGAHDHYKFDKPLVAINPLGDTTWIVQAGSFYLYLGKTKLAVDGGKVRILDYSLIPIDSRIPKEPTIDAMVNQLIAGIESVYGPMFTQQVAVVDSFFQEVVPSPMTPGWKDTPIGDLVADTYRNAFHTQIGIQPGGSTAEPLYRGPIVGADVFRVVGYGFNEQNGLGYRMATFRMSGAALLAGLEFGVSDIESGDEYLLQVSGMAYSYNPSVPPLSGRVKPGNVLVGGKPLDVNATYSIAANEFVPMFLTALNIPFSNLHVFTGDTTEFQTLLAAVMTMGRLRPQTDGRVRVTVTGVDGGAIGVPQKYLLEQNYPNPFNPVTEIRFQISGFGFQSVKLVVYDVLGREVAVLVNESMGSGRHSVAFDGSGLASGVYLYRLSAGPFTETKRMILLK